MAKYKESTITGDSWVRANQIICTNPYNSIPTIQYIEEEIFNLSNGDTIKKTYTRDNLAQITEQFTQANANEAFPLINPLTGEDLGTTATYQDLYVILHSLYFYLATKVDRGPKPYPSWVWSDTSNKWEAPIPKPETGEWVWDETNGTWISSQV